MLEADYIFLHTLLESGDPKRLKHDFLIAYGRITFHLDALRIALFLTIVFPRFA